MHHGESLRDHSRDDDTNDDGTIVDRMDEMLDAIRPEFNLDSEDPPNPEVKAFFEALKASEEVLHEHTEVILLAFVIRLLAIKSKFAFSNNCYNEVTNLNVMCFRSLISCPWIFTMRRK